MEKKPSGSGRSARQVRLKDALKANLARRKAQAKARGDAANKCKAAEAGAEPGRKG